MEGRKTRRLHLAVQTPFFVARINRKEVSIKLTEEENTANKESVLADMDAFFS